MERKSVLHKILFIGPMGAGKTTAIACISDSDPITTDVQNSDNKQSTKSTTTVAMDYGSIALGDDMLHLYGIPGQLRFKFIWPILARGALGCIVLLDETRENPLEDLDVYLSAFPELIKNYAFVVGVTKTAKDGSSLEKYNRYFEQHEQYPPVLEVDVSKKADVLMMLEILLINQEIKG